MSGTANQISCICSLGPGRETLSPMAASESPWRSHCSHVIPRPGLLGAEESPPGLPEDCSRPLQVSQGLTLPPMSAAASRINCIRPRGVDPSALPGFFPASPLECAAAKNTPVSALECVLAKTKDLNCPGINTYRKHRGGGPLASRRLTLTLTDEVHYVRRTPYRQSLPT